VYPSLRSGRRPGGVILRRVSTEGPLASLGVTGACPKKIFITALFKLLDYFKIAYTLKFITF
jgi:hypothetical protein